MYTDKITSRILSSDKLISYLTNNKPAVGFCISGSRMFNLQDENSDYDINVIIDNTHSQEIKQFTSYTTAPVLYFKDTETNTKIHWYYHTESEILNKNLYHFNLWIVEFYYATLYDYKANAISIINDEKYKNFINNTLYKQYKKSLLKLKLRYNSTIKSFKYLSTNDFGNMFIKDYYHLCLISLLIQNKSVAEYKNALIALRNYAKRNAKKFSDTIYTDFDPTIMLFAQKNIEWLSNYFDTIEPEKDEALTSI